jgi:hypothetical protein
MTDHEDSYEAPALTDFGTIEDWTLARGQIDISIIIPILP